ncbi:pilus assembly protein PilN, partial [Myxococcus sp. AM009]|nr:pilus assembly protein PilN [Myxococcus sp. AM009]
TGQPPQIERVNEWVKTLTSHLQKQVAIDVRVFKVHVNREDNYGLNLSLAVNTLYQGYQNGAKFTVTSAAAPSVTSGVTPVQFGASILSGTLSGTNAAVQALSAMGNVSQVFSRSGVTMNGQMLNLQAAQTQSYLASSQTTLTSTSGSST